MATANIGAEATANGNMDSAYDKLHAQGKVNARPGSEPVADFGQWTDQPFLPDMTRKAIELLSADESHPFALQVEGALVDKQSHGNDAAGTIWEVIDLDHAVGVARDWAAKHGKDNTLILVTADHDQTMTLIGVADISDADLTDRSPVAEVDGEKIYKDVKANLRSQIAEPMLNPKLRKFAELDHGFPDYQDANKDGFPDNKEVGGKGRKRLAVGFRTGEHAATSVPITAEGPGAALFTGYMDQTGDPLPGCDLACRTNRHHRFAAARVRKRAQEHYELCGRPVNGCVAASFLRVEGFPSGNDDDLHVPGESDDSL